MLLRKGVAVKTTFFAYILSCNLLHLPTWLRVTYDSLPICDASSGCILDAYSMLGRRYVTYLLCMYSVKYLFYVGTCDVVSTYLYSAAATSISSKSIKLISR